MLHKNKNYRRWQVHKHISRKKAICNYSTSHPVIEVAPNRYVTDFSRDIPMEWYDVDGKYNKGKIHCNCGICKFSKKYGLPTLRTLRENEKFKGHLEDYYCA